jgi:hypothetical protein
LLAITGRRWQRLELIHPQPNLASIENHSKELGLAQQNCCPVSTRKNQQQVELQKTPGSRLRCLAEGSYYVSWYDGTKKRLEPVGPEPGAAATRSRRKWQNFPSLPRAVKSTPAYINEIRRETAICSEIAAHHLNL